MNLFFIEKYIKELTKEDIYKYANKKNIPITEKETTTIYNTIKTNYKTFILNKEIRPTLLNDLKSKVSNNIANKLDELYNNYKNKI